MLFSWRDKWHIVEQGLGGGQGDCYKVALETDSSKCFFLKQIKDYNNSERRRRFYIETIIYESIQIKGLPRIIETNTNLFKEKDIPLYYVSEFIEGKQLDDYIQLNTPNEEEIIVLFEQLLKILSDCHERNVIHRDIKPENIIVKDGEIYLVDFGISYYPEAAIKNLTKVGIEIGNRFLRLPEHSAGSLDKRESISDLTMAIGVAFFMLTNKYPRKLVNEKGEYPHQTEDVRKKIEALEYSKIWNLLFDRGFQQKMSSRWNTASEIFKVMHAMSKKENELDRVKEFLKIHEEQIDDSALHVIKSGLNNVHQNMEVGLKYVLNVEAKGFEHEKQNRVYTLGDTEMRAQVRVFPRGNGDLHLIVEIMTRLIGEQVVGYINLKDKKHEIIRIPIGSKYQSKKVSGEGSRMIREELEKLVLPALVELLP